MKWRGEPLRMQSGFLDLHDWPDIVVYKMGEQRTMPIAVDMLATCLCAASKFDDLLFLVCDCRGKALV